MTLCTLGMFVVYFTANRDYRNLCYVQGFPYLYLNAPHGTLGLQTLWRKKKLTILHGEEAHMITEGK